MGGRLHSPYWSCLSAGPRLGIGCIFQHIKSDKLLPDSPTNVPYLLMIHDKASFGGCDSKFYRSGRRLKFELAVLLSVDRYETRERKSKASNLRLMVGLMALISFWLLRSNELCHREALFSKERGIDPDVWYVCSYRY